MIDSQILANRKSITGGEDRIKNYKDLLTEIFKNKNVIFSEWYKDFLRDMKNFEEKRLKEKYNTFKIVAQKFEELKNY